VRGHPFGSLQRLPSSICSLLLSSCSRISVGVSLEQFKLSGVVGRDDQYVFGLHRAHCNPSAHATSRTAVDLLATTVMARNHVEKELKRSMASHMVPWATLLDAASTFGAKLFSSRRMVSSLAMHSLDK
jgi:hypothetical protein